MVPVADLAEVERCIANKAWRGRFPPVLEAAFFLHSRDLRMRTLNKQTLPLLIIYNLFLLADIYLLPDTWILATILHLAVVTPIIVLLWYVYPRISDPVLNGLVDGAPTALMVGQIMLNYALNEGGANGHYQYFAVLVLINANVNMRTRHAVAVPLSVLVVSVFTFVLFTGSASIEAKVAGTCTMVSAAFITLVGNMRFDWDARHYFLRSLQDKLRFQNAEAEAMNDALTGLKNRRYLEEFSEQVLPNIAERKLSLGAIMVDIDHFKDYNDAYGHQAGDDCIRAVAAAIRASVREHGDLAIRYGGEEFLVLVPGAGISQVLKAAERIRRAVLVMQMPHRKNSAANCVTVSAGVSTGAATSTCLSALISEADMELYAAKAAGRNQVRARGYENAVGPRRS